MEHECGAPAFDNIDDVLADRIVSHSRTHSDRTNSPRNEQPAAASPATRNQPKTGHTKSRIRLFLILGVALLTLLILFNRRFTRLPQR